MIKKFNTIKPGKIYDFGWDKYVAVTKVDMYKIHYFYIDNIENIVWTQTFKFLQTASDVETLYEDRQTIQKKK